MSKLLVFIGITVGSWIGWAVGARYSLFAAFLLSIVGLGLGLYLARRLVNDYF